MVRHGVKAEVSVLARTLPHVSEVLARQAVDIDAGLLVMGAYRLFSWLCSRGLTDTLTWVLGAAALVLAALGLLLASRSFRRLKELHL